MVAAFSPASTALLVIDPVNDFLSEGGAAWDLTKGTVLKNDVVSNLRRLIEGARERGIPVLFGPMAYTEEDYADEQWQRRSGINRVMFERKMFLAGTWGADFHPDLRPLDTETVLQPHKGTDVFETDLPDHLQRLGTRQLVIAGMTANLCCESTGRHATEHGYDVTFVWDAIGAETLPAYEAYIPLEAIVKRSGNTVFINVPKLVIGYMPWNEPPTKAAQQAKRGPRRDDVEQLYGSRSPSGLPG